MCPKLQFFVIYWWRGEYNLVEVCDSCNLATLDLCINLFWVFFVLVVDNLSIMPLHEFLRSCSQSTQLGYGIHANHLRFPLPKTWPDSDHSCVANLLRFPSPKTWPDSVHSRQVDQVLVSFSTWFLQFSRIKCI